MKKLKEETKNVSILCCIYRILPLLLLFFIGLVKTNTLSYHQKVFKTLLIFVSCVILLLFLFLSSKKKSIFSILHLFFAVFFILYLLQYLVTFFSGEICYDREYYIANYTFLLIFSFLTSLFFEDESDFLLIARILPLFMALLFCIILHDWIQYVSYPKSISPFVYQNVLSKNLTKSELEEFDYFYREGSPNYRLEVQLTPENKARLKHLMKKGEYYKKVSYKNLLAYFRPALSFGNTNYFAAYLAGLLPLAIMSFFIQFDRKKSLKENKVAILCGFSALLGLVTLVITQTTSAFFGLFLTCLVLVIPSVIIGSRSISKRTKIILLSAEIGVFVLLPIILWFVLPDIMGMFFPRIVKKLSAPIFAIRDRFNGWTPALALFQHHPLTGAGLGSVYPASFKYISKYFYIYSNSNSFKHAHNEFVELLGEGGIIALFLFLFLCCFLVFHLLRIFFGKSRSKTIRYSALGIAAGICAMLGQQLFDLSLRMSVSMAAFFWLIGAGMFLILSCPPQKQGKLSIFLWRKRFEMPNIILIIGAAALLIAGMIIARPLFSAEYFLIQALRSPEYQKELLAKAHTAMPENPYVLNHYYSYHAAMMQNGIEQYEVLCSETPIPSDKVNYIQNFVQKMYQDALSDLFLIYQSIPGYQDVWSKRCSLNINYIHFLSISYQMQPKQEYIDSIFSLKKEILNDLENSLNRNFLNRSNHISRIYLLTELQTERDVEQAVREYLESEILLNYAKKLRLLRENVKILFIQNDTPRIERSKVGYSFEIPELLIQKTVVDLMNGDNIAEKLQQLYLQVTKG